MYSDVAKDIEEDIVSNIESIIEDLLIKRKQEVLSIEGQENIIKNLYNGSKEDIAEILDIVPNEGLPKDVFESFTRIITDIVAGQTEKALEQYWGMDSLLRFVFFSIIVNHSLIGVQSKRA